MFNVLRSTTNIYEIYSNNTDMDPSLDSTPDPVDSLVFFPSSSTEPGERYRKGGFHPVHIDDILHDRYQVVNKLGHWHTELSGWSKISLKLQVNSHRSRFLPLTSQRERPPSFGTLIRRNRLSSMKDGTSSLSTWMIYKSRVQMAPTGASSQRCLGLI